MGLISYGAFCFTQDAPLFFLYKSALTHHWPQASGGIPFGAVRSSRKPRQGFLRRGRQCRIPTEHLAAIAGQLAAPSADAAPQCSGTEPQLPTAYAPLWHRIFFS